MQSQIVQKQGQGEIHDHNALFDRKIDLITAGLQPFLTRFLKDENEVSKDNALIICNYIMAMKTEINLSDNYRRTTLVLLIRLCMQVCLEQADGDWKDCVKKCEA